MSNTEIVLAFVEAWNTLDFDAVSDLLDDDILWHNIPLDQMQGKTVIVPFIKSLGLESCHLEVLSIAENGNKVLTERIDRLRKPGGNEIVLPVMGTFEIANSKIIVWRDYFDLATLTSQQT